MQIPCINKQRWNKDKSRCKCKESIGKEICDKVFIQNPSNFDCECDRGYLYYENWKCRKNQLKNLLKNKLKILMQMK